MKTLLLALVLVLSASSAFAQADVVASVKASLQARGVDLSGPCGAQENITIRGKMSGVSECNQHPPTPHHNPAIGGRTAMANSKNTRFQTIDLEQRFWQHVNKTDDGCWLWTGARQRAYGKVRIYLGLKRYTEKRANRVAWELTYGPIPDGLVVCHKCDVPLCVRPDHLFLGTRADNLADMDAKGRRVRHPKLTAAQAAYIRDTDLRRGELTRLAREWGVDHATLSLIKSGKNWKHL